MVGKTEWSRRRGSEKVVPEGTAKAAGADCESDLVWDLLDCFSLGTVILRNGRNVVGMNRAAAEIVKRKDGLVVDRGRLRALDATDDALLESLVAYSSNGSGRRSPGFVQISRSTDHRPYDVCIAKIASPANNRGTALFVYDQDACSTSVFTLARSLFNLTAAEARVVQGLADGFTLHQIAEELRISLHTVRTHLKSVFAKTETRRQSDLLRLVLSGLGALSLDS